MISPAAASGFVVLLLFVQVVQGQNGWGVTFTSTQICAVKGSTVELSCNYQHPNNMSGENLTVQKTFWFVKVLVDLTTDKAYADRVEYSCNEKRCSLRIRDLRESDSAVYRFRFITNPAAGCYSSPTGVTLAVTDPHFNMQSLYSYGTCHSDCHLPDPPSYVWYKNGHAIGIETPSHSGNFGNRDSLSCALRGYEDFASASVSHLALQVHVTRTSDYNPHLHLKCVSSCIPSGDSYIWFKNGATMNVVTSSFEHWFDLEDRISCALKRYEQHRSPEVYAPKIPYALVNPSGEIMEGSSVTLTCSSDANPAANYTWYKRNGNPAFQHLNSQLIFYSIQSSDSGLYYCTVENALGKRTTRDIGIDVKYAPKSASLSVSPSAEIMEGSSVTLTCSSDANPAAIYTLYRENQTLLQGQKGIFYLTSISSNDSGIYYCMCENKYEKINSTHAFLDVQYAPKLLSVSVSPSGEIMEGSSVNLTCSSDANPAATYTWYKENKENKDSPKASGQTFTITNATPKHSGKYYCEVRNIRGRHNASLDLIIVPGPLKSAAVGSITVIVLAIVFLSAFLLIRRQWSLKKTSESRENPDNTAQQDVDPQFDNPSTAVRRESTEQQDDLYYSSVRFCKKQEDPLYSNIMIAWPNKQKEEEEEEDVEYTAVNFNNGSPGPSRQETVENPSAVYSTVNKKH